MPESLKKIVSVIIIPIFILTFEDWALALDPYEETLPRSYFTRREWCISNSDSSKRIPDLLPLPIRVSGSDIARWINEIDQWISEKGDFVHYINLVDAIRKDRRIVEGILKLIGEKELTLRLINQFLIKSLPKFKLYEKVGDILFP